MAATSSNVNKRSPTVTFLGSGDAFGDGGRYQACIQVESGSFRVLLDCGATSLSAMKRFGADPRDIDAVVVSHYHADHYGGIPFLLLDAHFSGRTRPLTIAGPGDVESRVMGALEVCFPGSSRIPRQFDVTFVGLSAGIETQVGDATVIPTVVAHTPGSDAIGLRMRLERNLIAYTGDTEWTPELRHLAQDAQLLICESYMWEKRVPFHLDYATIAAHRGELATERLILTHMGPEMLAHVGEIEVEAASDGLRLTL